MRQHEGFTLIELMIVIAIIAIIAAIAVPGLLASQRASNERNASASLKTLATAENDFRTNDRDGNHVNDFWTNDLAGLFSISPPGATSSAAIKLIDITLAGADTNPPATISWTASGTPAPSTETAITSFILSSPKAGYWYYALVSDRSQSSPTGVPYKTETDGSGSSLHNGTMFGFGCFPDSFSSGRQIYLVNEGNTVFRRQVFSNVRQGTGSPPSPQYPLNNATTLLNPTDNPQNWPDDTNLKADYAKMD
jgi:prepilin-type N-terminal cleavage/methylation domain-containing protein